MAAGSARLRSLFVLMAALCSLGAAPHALAGSDEPDEEGPAQTPVVYHAFAELRLGEALRSGRIPIICGEPASGEKGVEFYVPEQDCRIEATFTVPAKVANWLGLKSRVIAQGVAGDMKDGYEVESYGESRVYFLKIRNVDALKAKLKRKRVRVLGGNVTGTITLRGEERIKCWGDPRKSDPKAKCPVRSEGAGGKGQFTWHGEGEGEMLCWRFMPWYLATPAKWGQMCPRPINV